MISYGSAATADFEIDPLSDGQTLSLGEVNLEIRHTPGTRPNRSRSACGKHMSAAASSTIGEQRATNYALVPMSEDQFVVAVTEGQSVAPRYFAFAADANRRKRDLLAGDLIRPVHIR